MRTKPQDRWSSEMNRGYDHSSNSLEDDDNVPELRVVRNHSSQKMTCQIQVAGRRGSLTFSDSDLPNQIKKRNSLDLERRVPSRMPSQSMRRHSDLYQKDLSTVNQSLQAMAEFVNMVESKPCGPQRVQRVLRENANLPPRRPQRQTSQGCL